MEHQALTPLLSLIESNKAYIDLNKRYIDYYTQRQINELNEMVQLIQQKKDITDQTSQLLEKIDMFPSMVDSELFERMKTELNNLNESTIDYFTYLHVKLSAVSNDIAHLPNLNPQTTTTKDPESDLQSKLNHQIKSTESRIQYLKTSIDTFNAM